MQALSTQLRTLLLSTCSSSLQRAQSLQQVVLRAQRDLWHGGCGPACCTQHQQEQHQLGAGAEALPHSAAPQQPHHQPHGDLPLGAPQEPPRRSRPRSPARWQGAQQSTHSCHQPEDLRARPPPPSWWGPRPLGAWGHQQAHQQQNLHHHQHHHQHQHQLSRLLSTSAAAAPSTAPSTSAAAAPPPQRTPRDWELNFVLPRMPSPVVKYRKPEDVVGQNSPLLRPYAYRKNLHPRQLVARIMSRPGINNLLPLLKLYQAKVDPVVVAAVLTKANRTHHRAPAAERPQLQKTTAQLLAWLLPYARFQLRYASVEAISATLWAWSRLPAPLRAAGAPGAWPADLAVHMLARACQARAPDQPGPHKLWSATPQQLALLAFCTSQVLPHEVARADPLVQQAAATLRVFGAARAPHFTPQGLALFSAGLAALSPAQARPLLDAGGKLSGSAARRIGLVTERQFSAGELVRLLRACVAAGARPAELFEKAVGQALAQLRGWGPGEVAGLAEVLGEAGVRHAALLGAMSAEVVRREGQAGAGQGFKAEQGRAVLRAVDKLAGTGAGEDVGRAGLAAWVEAKRKTERGARKAA